MFKQNCMSYLWKYSFEFHRDKVLSFPLSFSESVFKILFLCVCVITFKIYPLNNFQACNGVLLMIVTMVYITSYWHLFFFTFFFFSFLFFSLIENYLISIHVFPILNPPPSSLPTPSLWVIPVHQPQASSIMHKILNSIVSKIQ